MKLLCVNILLYLFLLLSVCVYIRVTVVALVWRSEVNL